jgi:hypothetical protein
MRKRLTSNPSNGFPASGVDDEAGAEPVAVADWDELGATVVGAAEPGLEVQELKGI